MVSAAHPPSRSGSTWLTLVHRLRQLGAFAGVLTAIGIALGGAGWLVLELASTVLVTKAEAHVSEAALEQRMTERMLAADELLGTSVRALTEEVRESRRVTEKNQDKIEQGQRRIEGLLLRAPR